MTTPEALNYPTGCGESFPVGANLQVCEGRDKMTVCVFQTTPPEQRKGYLLWAYLNHNELFRQLYHLNLRYHYMQGHQRK